MRGGRREESEAEAGGVHVKQALANFKARGGENASRGFAPRQHFGEQAVI